MHKAAFHCLIACFVLAPIACGGESNGAPTASLSAEIGEVAVGDAVVVDGSSSTDPDGDPLLFRWSLETPEDSSVDLGAPRTRSISFNPDVAGTYTVGLTVDDGEFETDGQFVEIEATGELIPQADAGPDQSVEVGDEVTLDGTGSVAPNDSGLFYRWSFQQKPQASQAELSDSEDAQPTFVADVPGDYIVELEVSTGDHDSEPDTVVISVGEGQNQPPTADAGDDQNAQAGVEVALDGTASSDPDSAELTYLWRFVSTPGEVEPDIIDAASASASFLAVLAGDYTVELEVRDDADEVDTDTVQITVECAGELLISEYIEGSGNNKAIELFNCGTEQLNLSNYHVCRIVNDNSTCTASDDLALSGALGGGDVYTICHNQIDTAFLNDPGDCDVSDNVVNFNGNDRVVVYEDTDDSGDFGTTDKVVDVFGEIEPAPDSEIWSEMTLRRCRFEPNDGESGFDYTEYFDEFGADDFSDFGVAPSEGCGE